MGDAGTGNCAGKVQLTLTADTVREPIAPNAFVSITLKAEIDGEPAPNNFAHISTTYGSFEASETEEESIHQIDATLENGSTVVKLHAPSHPGTAVVTATVDGQCADNPSGTLSVDFFIPPASSILFSCRSANIGVLADTASDFAVGCDAMASDESQQRLPRANIRFLAEAGSIVKAEDASEDLPGYVYYPRQGARPRPKDVPPLSGEPSMMVGSVTRNPRDNLTTLVAYVEGNNTEVGNMFMGDPFVDMNDNQTWDPDEPFFSADGSNIYSPAQTLYVWTQVKVLWTGVLSQNQSIAKCEVTGTTSNEVTLGRTGAGAHATYKFTLLDDYFNVLAANGFSDVVSWQLTPAGQISFDSGQLLERTLQSQEIGMTLDQRGNFPWATSSDTFGINDWYLLRAHNARDPADTDGDKFYTVSGTIQRHLTIDESGEADRLVGDEVLPACGGTLK